MSEMTHLLVAFLILGALSALALIGTWATSPVLAIFAVVFLLAAALVLAEIRSRR